MIAARRQELLAAIDRAVRAGRPIVAQLLLNAVASDLPAPCAAVAQARIHLAEAAPGRARVVLDAALATTSDGHAALLTARSQAWLAEGDRTCALRDAAAAAAIMPPDPHAVGLYASLLMDLEDFARAAVTLRDAIDQGAVDVALHTALVLALLCMDEVEAADLAIAEARRAFPQHRDLRRLADKCRDRRHSRAMAAASAREPIAVPA